MGSRNKENVQTVISHLEGCSGNFLGYLAADVGQTINNMFRIDVLKNNHVLSIDGRGESLYSEVETGLKSHSVVVTHNYDLDQLRETFPNAELIQLYPYTHIGNVLYNICYKKLTTKLDNIVDNHLIDLNIWFKRLESERPNYSCHDFWDLTDKNKVQQILRTSLTASQQQFFDQYWGNQLPLELEIPATPMSITELIDYWKIHNVCTSWMIAWVIFVFEKINNLSEHRRLWSIDNLPQAINWQILSTIEKQYS